MIIKNANIIDKNGNILENKDIQFKNNLIINLGENLIEDSEIIELNNSFFISPGFIDAHCHIGMWEAVNGESGSDGNECTDPITPHLRAIDGINPNDEWFKDALKGGVTTICTGPGSANVIGGSFCIMKTFGDRVDDMLINPSYAIKGAFGENPKNTYGSEDKMPQTRMGIAALMREYFYKAKEYMEDIESGENVGFDIKLDALIPVLKKECPMKFHAHRADDIFTAIRIAKEFNINITLDHCTEAHLIAKHLKNEKYPIIIGPTFGEKTKYELINKSFETPKILFDNNIPFAIMTDAPELPIESLTMCASLAVKYGLPENEALKAISITPAKILGIDNILGSIEINKNADLVVWDRHPLDIQAKVQMVFINGKMVYKKEG
ncbi:MAG: amidohydrolase [Clostridiales bacterium]|nr:MAG: amidohydrolase [Clostridiales bacterium]